MPAADPAPSARHATPGLGERPVTDLADLEALYGAPGAASLEKVANRVTPHYRALIEASPFLALATAGPEGLDVSPRGDRPGALVRVENERTLLLPDRRGNDRIDSLRNVLRDPRVGLMFLIPGWGNALRVNGRARVEAAPALLESFAVDGKAPRSVLVIDVAEVYFQCARAIVRSALWSGPSPSRAALPTPGRILAELSAGRVGGETYDREWPERAAKTMW